MTPGPGNLELHFAAITLLGTNASTKLSTAGASIAGN